MTTSALVLPNTYAKKKTKKSAKKKSVKKIPLDEQVVNSIRRDLERLNWKFKLPTRKNAYPTLVPPENYDKETIKNSMSFKRNEIIVKHKKWIKENMTFARKNLAKGIDVLNSEIDPVIEICETEKQHRLFRMLRYYWSSPYSEYVGRRIKLIINGVILSMHNSALAIYNV